MVAEVFAGLSAIKTAFDIAKGLKDIDNATSRNAAVIELQEKILAARETQTALLDRVGELEKEMASFETWEREKQRYELKDLYRGFFAYIPKLGMEQGEPPHALCTNCYQRRIKSILQTSGHVVVHQHFWFCPSCNTQIKSQWHDMASLIKRGRESGG